VNGRDGRTDGRTDTRQPHRACSVNAGSGNKAYRRCDLLTEAERNFEKTAVLLRNFFPVNWQMSFHLLITHDTVNWRPPRRVEIRLHLTSLEVSTSVVVSFVAAKSIIHNDCVLITNVSNFWRFTASTLEHSSSGKKSFDSIRFGNLINLPLVH